MMSNPDRARSEIERRGRQGSAKRHHQSPPVVAKIFRAGFVVFGRMFPRSAGAVAYALVFRPRRARHTPAGKALLDSALIDSSVICNRKTVVSYVWGNSGPTVLLVHGWGSSVGRFSRLVTRLLAAGYKIVAFDAPGHGRSDGKQTDMMEFTQVIGSLGAKYGPFEAVIGHSFGGMCLSYSVRHGLPAKAVVLISSPSRFDQLKDKLQALLSAPEKVIANVSSRVEKRFAGHSSDVWKDFSARENATMIDRPALIVHDEDDEAVSIHEAEDLHAAWKGSHLLLTNGLGHHRIAHDECVLDAVVQFIKETGALQQPAPLFGCKGQPERS